MTLLWSISAVPCGLSAQGFVVDEGTRLTLQQNLDIDGSIGQIDAGGLLQTIGDSILSSGNDVQLYNSGEIRTANAYSVSFTTSGANVRIANSGVSVSDGAFLVSTGDDLFLENSGYLESTLGKFSPEGSLLSLAYTLYSSGDHAVIENSGEIKQMGSPPSISAILSEGEDAMITNFTDGRIYSEGSGIVTHGFGVTVVNDGYIETQANKFDLIGSHDALNAPIHSSGSNARIFNTGDLVASGISSDSIFSSGSNASIINTGRLRAGVPFQGTSDPTVGNGTGIFSTGSSAKIVNTGVIERVQFGIQVSGESSQVINRGVIDVRGHVDDFGYIFPSYGILSKGQNVIVTHSGTITGNDVIADGLLDSSFSIVIPKATDGIGLDPFGIADGVANISGKISVTGNAILGGDGEQVVNLRNGAQIVGAIDLGGGEDTINVETTRSSFALTFLNVENIFLSPETNGVISGNTIYTVDPSVFSYQAQTVNAVTSHVHGSMIRRAQLANATSSFWVDASALDFDFDSSRKMSGYEHDAYIFSLGFEFHLDSGKVGVLAGYSEGDVEGDGVSFEDDISSIVLGGYFRLPFDFINLTTSVLIGHEEHGQRRYVLDNMSGMKSVEAQVDSYFVSPSVSLDSVLKVRDNVYLVPSSRLGYTLAYFEDYAESGTGVGEYSVDDWCLHILNFRTEVASVYKFRRGAYALVVGMDSRYSDESSIDAAIAGEDLGISPANDSSVVTGFLAARASIRVLENLLFVGDVESRFSGNEDGVFGRLQLSVAF